MYNFALRFTAAIKRAELVGLHTLALELKNYLLTIIYN